MTRRSVHICIICLMAAALFFVSNHYLRGYLSSEIDLGREIKSAPDSLYQFKLANESPFKYRLVFQSVIQATYQTVSSPDNSKNFYRIYKGWSLVFYVASAIALYFLLITVGFGDNYSLAGVIIFLLLPPMLVAFTLPVHTREDTLGYVILFSGLIAMLKSRRWVFMAICVLGALTRETLLILPLLYFFFSNDTNVFRKIAITTLPMVAFMLPRLLMDRSTHDVWLGLRWNISNPEQVLGFLFISFNVCWIPLIFHFLSRRIYFVGTEHRHLGFFYRSALFTVCVILITTFFGGICNEIRLLFLLSPWMIVLLLDFVDRNKAHFWLVLRSRGFMLFGLVAFIFCSGVLFVVERNSDKFFKESQWGVPLQLWIILAVIYGFLTLLFLPISYRVYKANKHPE